MKLQYFAFAICLSAIAGCGQNEHPRVDFPATQGNYVQFYDGVGASFAEFAVVDQSGNAQTVIGQFEDRISYNGTIPYYNLKTEVCGVFSFKISSLGPDKVTSDRAAYGDKCQLKQFPALWNLINPAPTSTKS